MSSSSPLMHSVANSPHCGHLGIIVVHAESVRAFRAMLHSRNRLDRQYQSSPIRVLHDCLRTELQVVDVHPGKLAGLDPHFCDTCSGAASGLGLQTFQNRRCGNPSKTPGRAVAPLAHGFAVRFRTRRPLPRSSTATISRFGKHFALDCVYDSRGGHSSAHKIRTLHSGRSTC